MVVHVSNHHFNCRNNGLNIIISLCIWPKNEFFQEEIIWHMKNEKTMRRF